MRAFHEPSPAMAGRRVIAYPATHPTPIDKLFYYGVVYPFKYQKVNSIRKILRKLHPGHICAETSHKFILSFSDVIMNHFRSSVDVVLLRRYLPKVIKSLMELNHFAPGNARSLHWLASPNAKSAAVQALSSDEELDQIDKIIAYLVDIEARAQRFKKKYPATRVIEVRVEELNNWENVERLFLQLGIEPSEQTYSVIGKVEYQRLIEKRQQKNWVSEEYCLERLLRYIDKCKKRICLPDLHPYLSKI